MSLVYEEIVNGETLLRSAPDSRHEVICSRLHDRVARIVASLSSTRLLSPRSVVRTSPGSMMRPDLALVTAAHGKLWLAAEVINSQDHRADTVVKKTIYEEARVSRLWMVDPRYNNVEIYHASPYGLVLKRILATADILEEQLLPGFGMSMNDLFA